MHEELKELSKSDNKSIPSTIVHVMPVTRWCTIKWSLEEVEKRKKLLSTPWRRICKSMRFNGGVSNQVPLRIRVFLLPRSHMITLSEE